MCYIITHILEFNNWNAFDEMVEFAMNIYGNECPHFNIEVPYHIRGYEGWDKLRGIHEMLMKEAPDDMEEMSIYGKIWFQVTKDYTRSHDERESLKRETILIGEKDDYKDT